MSVEKEKKENKNQKKRSKKEIVFAIISWFFIALLGVFRMWIQSVVPLYPNVNAQYDDLLMVRYADRLGSSAGWLGPYDTFTLNKLPGYAVFLRFVHLINGRYEVAYGLVLCLACILLYLASYKLMKSRIMAFIMYVTALFCPIMIECNVSGRIYCIALVPICTITLIASYMGIIANRNEGFLRMLPWTVLAALTYAYYRVLRYDYMWISCFLIGITAYLVILYLIEHKKEGIKKLILSAAFYMVPIVTGIFATNALCLLNYVNYNIYTATDFNETHFADMCSLIMSIEPDKEIPGVYVTKDALYKAAEVSPKLKRLVDERDKSGWSFTRPEDGEIQIDFYAWNLRYAADALGLYGDAPALDAYYAEICDDLEKAFEDGRLKKRDVITISPFSAPLAAGEIPDMIYYSFAEGFGSVLRWDDVNATYKVSSIPEDHPDSLLFEEMTGEEVISEDELDNGITLIGWFYPKKAGDELSVVIYDQKGNEFRPEFESSDDVYNVYGDEAARKCRINCCINDNSGLDLGGDLYIKLILNGKTVYEAPVVDIVNAGDIEGIRYSIGQVNKHHYKKEVVVLRNVYERSYRVFYYTLLTVRTIAPYVAILLAAIMLIEIIMYIVGRVKKRETEFLPIMLKLGILITMWVTILLQSERNFKDWDMFSPFYGAASFMLYSILTGLCLATLAGWIISAVKRPRKNQVIEDNKQEPVAGTD